MKPPCRVSSQCVCPVPENVGGISSVLMTAGRRVRAGLGLPGLQHFQASFKGGECCEWGGRARLRAKLDQTAPSLSGE